MSQRTAAFISVSTRKEIVYSLHHTSSLNSDGIDAAAVVAVMVTTAAVAVIGTLVFDFDYHIVNMAGVVCCFGMLANIELRQVFFF